MSSSPWREAAGPRELFNPTRFRHFLSSSPQQPFRPTPRIRIAATLTMTRTERSQSLRALLKDRSEARNGMDSSVPKGGAGAYNWGSIDSEFDYENAALADEAAEFDDQAEEAGGKRPLADVRVWPSVLSGVSQPPNPNQRNLLLCVARAASPTRTVRMPSRSARLL